MKQFFFFLFCCTTAVFAQEVDIAKDTIRMKEVVIKENFRKLKETKVRLKGECHTPETMKDASEIITLVDNLPAGYLNEVTLYFNEIHYKSYKSDHEKFQDTEFEVVLYTVNADNTPGERIMKDEKYIKIMKNHTGAAVVHFLEFNIKDQRKLFIGLRSTAGTGRNTEFYIDCMCEKNKYISFSRNSQRSSWEKYKGCEGIKMDVNILAAHK